MAKRTPKHVDEQAEIPGAENPAYQYNPKVDRRAKKYCDLIRKSRYYAGLAEDEKPLLDAKMEEAQIEHYVLKNGDEVTIDVTTKRKLSVTLAKGKDGKMIPPDEIEVEEIEVGD